MEQKIPLQLITIIIIFLISKFRNLNSIKIHFYSSSSEKKNTRKNNKQQKWYSKEQQ